MEQKLPADWRAEIDRYCSEVAFGPTANETLTNVARRLYALTQKPKKELTDLEVALELEKASCWGPSVAHDAKFFAGIRAVIAAHEAKQREPEKVKFRAAMHGADCIQMFALDRDGNPENKNILATGWEWLDHDGKPQSFEVVLP